MHHQMEIRQNDAGIKTLVGYAVKWQMESREMGHFRRFREKFAYGAFKESLVDDDQFALWSHDTSKILGSTKNGTLRLFEDDVGLRFELDLPNTTLGNDTYETIKRGDVNGVSFGFFMENEKWNEANKENITREITKARLLEISPVAYPAYPDSGVSLRSNDPYKNYFEARKKKLILKTYLKGD